MSHLQWWSKPHTHLLQALQCLERALLREGVEGAQRTWLAFPALPRGQLAGQRRRRRRDQPPGRRTWSGLPTRPSAPRRSAATGSAHALWRHCEAEQPQEASLLKGQGTRRKEGLGAITLPHSRIAHLHDGGMKRKWGFLSKQRPLRRARRRCTRATREQKRARLLGLGPALVSLTSPFFESLFPCQSMGILLAFFQKTAVCLGYPKGAKGRGAS